jgi:hypothetical protein
MELTFLLQMLMNLGVKLVEGGDHCEGASIQSIELRITESRTRLVIWVFLFDRYGPCEGALHCSVTWRVRWRSPGLSCGL